MAHTRGAEGHEALAGGRVTAQGVGGALWGALLSGAAGKLSLPARSTCRPIAQQEPSAELVNAASELAERWPEPSTGCKSEQKAARRLVSGGGCALAGDADDHGLTVWRSSQRVRARASSEAPTLRNHFLGVAAAVFPSLRWNLSWPDLLVRQHLLAKRSGHRTSPKPPSSVSLLAHQPRHSNGNRCAR